VVERMLKDAEAPYEYAMWRCGGNDGGGRPGRRPRAGLSSRPKRAEHGETSGRVRLAIARFRAYIIAIDIWPDNWAAPPLHLQARTFQTFSPRSTSRDDGREISCANSRKHTVTKGYFHEYGHSEVLQRPIQQRSATGRFLALKKASRGVR
jgi:hypothetical protein